MLRLGGKGVTVTINRRSEMGRSHRINSWTTVDVEYIVFYFYFIFPFSPGIDWWYWVSESGPCGTPNDQFYFLFSHFRFFVSSVLILNPRFCSSDLISKHKSKEENKKRGFWEIQAVWPTFLPYPVYKAGKGERSKMLQGRGYPSSLPTGEFYSFIFRGTRQRRGCSLSGLGNHIGLSTRAHCWRSPSSLALRHLQDSRDIDLLSWDHRPTRHDLKMSSRSNRGQNYNHCTVMIRHTLYNACFWGRPIMSNDHLMIHA